MTQDRKSFDQVPFYVKDEKLPPVDELKTILSTVEFSEQSQRMLLLAKDEPPNPLNLHTRFAGYICIGQDKDAGKCLSWACPSLPSVKIADNKEEEKLLEKAKEIKMHYYNLPDGLNYVVQSQPNLTGTVHEDIRYIAIEELKKSNPKLAGLLNPPPWAQNPDSAHEIGISLYIKPEKKDEKIVKIVVELGLRSTFQRSMQKLSDLAGAVFFLNPKDYVWSESRKMFIYNEDLNKAREATLSFHLGRSLNSEYKAAIAHGVREALSKIYGKASLTVEMKVDETFDEYEKLWEKYIAEKDVKSIRQGILNSIYILSFLNNCTPGEFWPGKTDATLVEEMLMVAKKYDIEINVDEVPVAFQYTRASPLICAVRQGKLELVKVLLAHKADPARKDENGKSAIDYAREQNNPEIIFMVSYPRLYDIVEKGDTIKFAQFLQEHKDNNYTADLLIVLQSFMSITYRNFNLSALISFFQQYIEYDARFEQKGSYSFEAIDKLMFNLGIKDVRMFPPKEVKEAALPYILFRLIESGSIDVLSRVMSKYKFNLSDPLFTKFQMKGMNLLGIAIHNGAGIEMIKLLLSHGADPNQAMPNGATPLELAKESDRKLIRDYGRAKRFLKEQDALLQHDDSLELKLGSALDRYVFDISALFFILEMENKAESKPALERLFEEHKIDVSQPLRSEFFTSLHMAVMRGDKSLVERLLDQRASIEIKPVGKIDVLDLAIAMGRTEIVDLCLDRLDRLARTSKEQPAVDKFQKVFSSLRQESKSMGERTAIGLAKKEFLIFMQLNEMIEKALKNQCIHSQGQFVTKNLCSEILEKYCKTEDIEQRKAVLKDFQKTYSQILSLYSPSQALSLFDSKPKEKNPSSSQPLTSGSGKRKIPR